MNVYCIVMFEFNYSVGDIKNSDLGEGIVCFGEGSRGKGAGKWGKGGKEVGERGREEGVRGEGSGECLPPCPPPHIMKLHSLISHWNVQPSGWDCICVPIDTFLVWLSAF